MTIEPVAATPDAEKQRKCVQRLFELARKGAGARTGCGGTGGGNLWLLPERTETARWYPLTLNTLSDLAPVITHVKELLTASETEWPTQLFDLMTQYSNIEFRDGFTPEGLKQILEDWPPADLRELLKKVAEAQTMIVFLNIPPKPSTRKWKFLVSPDIPYGGQSNLGFILRTELPDDRGEFGEDCHEYLQYLPAGGE